MLRSFSVSFFAVSFVFPSAAFTQTDAIFPDGPVTSGTSIGIGTKRGVTPYGTVVTSVTQSLTRVGTVETSVTQSLARVGTVETSVTQSLARGLQGTMEQGPQSTIPMQLGLYGTTNMDPVTLPAPVCDPLVSDTFFAVPLPPLLTLNAPLRSVEVNYEIGNIESDCGPTGNFTSQSLNEEYANQIFLVARSSNEAEILRLDRNGIFGPNWRFGGSSVQSRCYDFTAQNIRVLENPATDFEGLSIGLPGVVAADRALVTAKDMHAGDAIYGREFVLGPGRQKQGYGVGSLIFGPFGTPSFGWETTRTLGFLKATSGTVELGSRISTDTINMANPLTVQGRRVPVILAKNTTVRTVTADTEDYAEFSFTLPAADAVAGTTIEIDVGGPMAGFGLDDNTYSVELLVDGVSAGNFVGHWLAIEPYTWDARYRVTLTSATAGRWDGRVEPDDVSQSGGSYPIVRSAGTWTASGDITFLIRAQRGGDSASAESLTMDWSEAVMTRP